MTTARGYGKKSQNWSYLTPKRAIAVQSGPVVDPATLIDDFNIDTTLTRKGDPVERGCDRTLVIYAIPRAGVTLAATSTLHLWIKVDWDEARSPLPAASSSSSSPSPPLSSSSPSFSLCPDVGEPSDLDDTDRWALVKAEKHANAEAGSVSLCFVFPRMPAGIYRAAIASALTGEVIIAEQHTE